MIVLAITPSVLAGLVWMILGVWVEQQPGSPWGGLQETIGSWILLPLLVLFGGVALGWVIERNAGWVKRWEERWESHPPRFYRWFPADGRRRLIPWFLAFLAGLSLAGLVGQLVSEESRLLVFNAVVGFSLGFGLEALGRVMVLLRDSTDPLSEASWQRRIAHVLVPLVVRLFHPWIAIVGGGGILLLFLAFWVRDVGLFRAGMAGVPVGLLLAWLWTRERSPLLGELQWQRVVRDVGRVLAGIALMLMVPLWGGSPEMEAVAAGLAGFLVGYVNEEENDERS